MSHVSFAMLTVLRAMSTAPGQHVQHANINMETEETQDSSRFPPPLLP